MNQQEPISKPEESLELEIDPIVSVDEFIKELEAKEKDLQITPDLTIEVEESEFDPRKVSDGFEQDFSHLDVMDANRQQGGPKTRVYELEQEVARLNEKIADLKTDRNLIQEKSDRRLKDFENYKYRTDRERRGAFIDQICNLATQMLPVLDNFDRALEAADRLNGEKSDEFQRFYDGIVLVHQQIKEIFSGMGVESIKTTGQTFDPNFHEAVSVEKRDDLPNNTVLEEMLPGYRIGNRVIRHSMVRVTASSIRPEPRQSSEDGPVDLNPPEDDTVFSGEQSPE